MDKNEVIKCASELFFRYGIRAVNMDEVALKLGVSKRTLYETFSSKEELVRECVNDMGTHFQAAIDRVSKIEDSTETFQALLSLVIESYKAFHRLSPSFYRDITNYSNLEHNMDRNHEMIHKATREIFERGVENGIIKNADDFEILTTMWACYNKHNRYEDPTKRVTPELFSKTISTVVKSLCTDYGVSILFDNIDNNKN